MKRASAQAHAKRNWFCTCGKIVRGNGGRHQHGQMHLRRQDGHLFLVERLWREKFKEGIKS